MTAMEIPAVEWDDAVSVGMSGPMTRTATVAADLDSFAAGDEPDWDVEPVPAESLDQANRWLRRIKRLDLDAAAIRAAADAERQRVNDWEAERLRVIDGQRTWLVRSCEMLTRALWDRDPKTATYQVPNGKLFSRPRQPEWVYDDEGVFIAWAETHAPGLVNRPDPPAPKPDKAAVKKAFGGCVPSKPVPGDEYAPILTADDGTVVPVPGLRVVARERDWKIETS